MNVISELDSWLDQAIPTNAIEDVYALYVAVETESRFGQYSAVRSLTGHIIVSCKDVTTDLQLSAPADREWFLWRLGIRYCGDEGVPLNACNLMSRRKAAQS